jgi:hypothetical protein
MFRGNIILPFSGFERVERPDYVDIGTGDESLHERQSSSRCIRSYLCKRKERAVAESPICVCVCIAVQILKKPTDLNEIWCILNVIKKTEIF